MDYLVILTSGTEYKVDQPTYERLRGAIGDPTQRTIACTARASGPLGVEQTAALTLNPNHIAVFEQVP